MLFYLFTFIAGLLLILVPFQLLATYSRKWSLPRSIFWRAGLAHVLISALYLGVVGNLGNVFPAFEKSPDFVQIAAVGIISGLFLELGRFVVLDRWYKKVRDFNSGSFFGLGWGGVNALLLGVLAIVNIFGVYYLVHTGDLKSQFPQATQEEIQVLEDAKKQAQGFIDGNPIVGLTPIVENVAQILVDIALTLLIVLALQKKQSRFTWLAVGLRAIFSGAVFAILPMNLLGGELMMAGFALVAGLGIFYLQKKLSPPSMAQA